MDARTRKKFCETKWQPGALPQWARLGQGSPWWDLLFTGLGKHEARLSPVGVSCIDSSSSDTRAISTPFL